MILRGHRDLRHRGARCTAAAGAIAALLLGAATLAERPERPRSVIYPVGRVKLRFDHTKHADQPCSRCHQAISRSTSAADRHAPREAVCRECHADLTRRDDSQRERLKGSKRCAFCHLGYDGHGQPPRLERPQARLRFSHRLHEARGYACGGCHRFGAQARAKSLPRMRECLACHRQQRATSRCVSCHLAQRDGRLQTRFGEQRLRPSGVLKGAAHTPQFSRQHAQVARGSKRYCESCHRPKDCLTCHAGSRKPLRIHRSDYVTHHALDAKRNQPRCSSCHRSQTFCLSCHQRLGVASSSVKGGFRPSTGKDFHRPGWNALKAGPGHHSYSARRNIRSCASCHEERACIRCHGTRRLGRGGFSPHPAGFARSLKCRALAARNHRACLKCHSSADRHLRCQ